MGKEAAKGELAQWGDGSQRLGLGPRLKKSNPKQEASGKN